MTPILYGKSETAFTSNGKGRLVDCISCTVTEERNGIYECEFEYPITGKFYEEMTVNGGVISVTHDDNGDRQAFDIYKYSAPINGIVTFNACHISYRLNGITVNPFTASSCSAALTAIGTNSMQTNQFTFWTDKSVSSTYTLANPASARGLLLGSEGSILDVYGKGEYEFDMFTVKLHTNRGSNSGVTVRYSKNLSSITKTYDESGVYNAVAPYWKGTDGTVVMLSEGYVYNSLPVIRCVPLDLSSEFSEAPTQAELRTRANAYLTANEPWTVDENITFDFVPLWQTDEYKSVAVLQKVKLCDTISVYYPKLGVTKVNAKIIKVVYDVLREKYASMEVGTAKQTLESTMLAPVEADISNINSDLSGKIISYINQTPEQITIQASKLSLLGYTTINNGFRVNLDGTFEANGATINGNFVSHGETPINHYQTTQSISNGEIESLVTIEGVDYSLFHASVTERQGNCLPALSFESAFDGSHSAINPFSVSFGGPDFDLTMSKLGVVYERVSDGTDDITPWELTDRAADFHVPVSAHNGLSVIGATSLRGDATVGGVLDVTNRRAADKLSTAGWYRVLTYEGTSSYQPNGATGALIRFNVVVWGNTSANGNHQIDLSTAYGTGHREFVNEFSNGQDTLIDKIRYTTEGNDFHVDVHFTGNSDNLVTVYFDPYIHAVFQDKITSEGLDPVADAPDGETVVTTYTFSQTGAHFGNVFSNGIQLFGLLSGGTAITSNADLNNYTTPGVYTCTQTVAATLTNSSITTVGFKMLVMENVTGTTPRWQICLASYDNCIVAIRWRNVNGVWQAWKRLTPA